MSLKKILIIIAIALTVALIATIGFLSDKPSKIRDLLPVLSSSPSPSTKDQPLQVVSTVPNNGGTSNYLDSPIQIGFNKEITLTNASIKIQPTVSYQIRAIGRLLFIEPSEPLAKSATYKIDLRLFGMNSDYSFSFSTPEQNRIDTGPSQTFIEKSDQELKQYPDLYLFNQIPYSEESFEVQVGAHKDTPTSHYSFVVFSKRSIDVSKSSFLSWLQRIGLNNNQINSLDVEYLDQNQVNSLNNLKESLPIYGDNFSILYSESKDETTINLDKNNLGQAETELSAYLSQYGISNRYWINSLIISYH